MSATGARTSVRRFNIAAENRKSAAAKIVKIQTKPTESSPAGNALVAVRGLRASKPRSAIRLKAIAADLAATIARTIQKTCRGEGSPFAASTAPRKAKGNAKSVCSIFIISSVSRVFRTRVDTVGLSGCFGYRYHLVI